MAETAQSGLWIRDRASFLEYLDTQDERWEFFAFVVKAMVGASVGHNRIARNLTRLLDDAVAGSPCEVLQDGIRLEPAHNQDVTFPAAMVVCEKLANEAFAVSRPILIAEVLSRTTQVFDRGPKWESYQGIDSLRHYLLVSQEERSVEVFSRSEDGKEWRYRRYAGTDATVELAAIEASLPLAEIYRGL